MAAVEISCHPQILNSLRIGRSTALGFQGRMLHVQRIPLLSSSSLSIESQSMKICVPYAMDKPMKGLSRKLNELKNTQIENLPAKLWEMCPEPVRSFPHKESCERARGHLIHLILVVTNWIAMKMEALFSKLKEMKNTQIESTLLTLWEMCPEPVRNFPWKEACKRVVLCLSHLLLVVAKWLAIPILVITFVTETSYCIAQNKELFIPISLFAGGVFAEILKETAIELSQNLKEGDFPTYLSIILSLFYFIKLPGPYYPYWVRIILPHFANGGLFRTLWLAKDYLYKKSFETAEAENNPR